MNARKSSPRLQGRRQVIHASEDASGRLGGAFCEEAQKPLDWWSVFGNPKALFLLPELRGGVNLLAEVRIQDGESLEGALRRFKRKVQQEDIIKEIKKHSYFLKPGERRRIKQRSEERRVGKECRL